MSAGSMVGQGVDWKLAGGRFVIISVAASPANEKLVEKCASSLLLYTFV